MPSNKFRKLSVNYWRQFRKVDLDFSETVTILTGRNGTGKSTILNILAQHSSYHTTFLSSPSPLRDSLGRFISSDTLDPFTSGVWSLSDLVEPTNLIGNIVYSNDQQSEIRVSQKVGVNFTPEIAPKVSVPVLNIPSHRTLPGYKRVDTIPTKPLTRASALDSYQREFWTNIRGETTRTTPLTKMKEALISMAAFGPGNVRVSPNTESNSALEDFENRLKEIIPKNIGFRRLHVQVPDVIVETDWPAPGSEDTELGVLMGPEVRHGETEVYARVQA